MTDALDPTAQRWRDALLSTVEATCPGWPLFLSGGMDSVTLLVADLVLGHRPPCYTFTVGGVEHSDLKAARRVAADAGVPLTVVDIPRTEAQLVADVEELLDLLDPHLLKVNVQCAQPMLHMARRMVADGLTHGVTGSGCIVQDNRAVSIIHRDHGEGAARHYRRQRLADRLDHRGVWAMYRAAESAGLTMAEPYTTEPVAGVGLSIDFAEMNRPRQKGIALRAFPEWFKRFGWWRENRPLQVASGVREWHDTLLRSEHNRRGSKAVIAVYRDMALSRSKATAGREG